MAMNAPAAWVNDPMEEDEEEGRFPQFVAAEAAAAAARQPAAKITDLPLDLVAKILQDLDEGSKTGARRSCTSLRDGAYQVRRTLAEEKKLAAWLLNRMPTGKNLLQAYNVRGRPRLRRTSFSHQGGSFHFVTPILFREDHEFLGFTDPSQPHVGTPWPAS